MTRPILLVWTLALAACGPRQDAPVFFVDRIPVSGSHTLEDDTRRALSTPVGEPAVVEVVVPESPALRFAVAASVDDGLPAPVSFRLLVDGVSVFETEVRRSRPNRWHEHEVTEALVPFAGRSVSLSFEASSPAAGSVEPLWGNPVLVSTEQAFERPNIVLISIDCLRADHLGAYGYARDTTPQIDALAKGAVVFENAVASSSYTLPTHASMLTGVPPSLHGATARRRIASSAAYAPELLARAGYRVDAVVSAPFLSPIYGFDRGFHTYRLTSVGAERLVDEAIERLRLGAGTPQFLFLHLFDVHMPYTPPRDLLERFGERPSDITNLLERAARREAPSSPREVSELISLYDGEVAHVDRELGRLFDFLRVSGLYERSLLIVTADHGEAFYEHGSWEHARPWHVGPGLYQEVLHIPLIVKWPGHAAPGRVRAPVSQADVFATLLKAAGVAADTDWSRALSASEPAGEAESGRAIVSEFVGQGEEGEAPHLYALREGSLKLIVSGSGEERLFDLADDPGEKSAIDDEDRKRRLKAVLEAYRRIVVDAKVGGNDITLSDEIRDELEALGYLAR